MIALRATIMNGSFLELHYQSGNGRNPSPKSRKEIDLARNERNSWVGKK